MCTFRRIIVSEVQEYDVSFGRQTHMTILVNVQRIGRKKPAIQPVPMELSGIPGTLVELITLCVEASAGLRRGRL